MNELSLPPERDLPAGWVQAREGMLVAEIRGERRRVQRKRRWVVVGSTTVLFLSGGAATAYMVGMPASDRDQIRCYTDGALTDGDDFHGTTLVGASRDETPVDVATGAVARCASLWRQGFLVAGASGPQDPDGRDHAVPALAACTLKSGIAAVFPGAPEDCDEAGLPRLLDR